MNKAIIIGASSGIGNLNEELDWNKEKEVIDVNVSGVTSIINIAIKHFMEKSSGQLVVISSVGGLRGSRGAPSYNASKAFLSNYLEGIRWGIMAFILKHMPDRIYSKL
ncbi:SDR family NAD(P)-dependent oxidoreductase [Clostridium botulinum]|uniref:SDR family NAD(P)-dependent oxidoreductase n=1 Tax=Clostridium botulinum TaxID=1491 RepID=UPI0001AAD838|nr:SDR family NAD(P)-dependent oxidoreductase [Clostridium botulinum]EES49748.1 short-chain dehydrogenase/reductase SDR [Clostridium botulinum E1 str. 'BoNT E Beluga']MCR1132168.1 SDR family NAD(P)-dependent oxidoreductase [Clostridium botulinum]